MANGGESERRPGWSTSLGMVAGLRADRAPAWERFVNLYATLLDHWFRRDCAPESEWPDLRQEVFLAVALALPDYRHEPGTGAFRGWLRVIARRKWIDRVRVKFPTPDTPLLADIPAPAPEEASAEQQVLFRRALDLVKTDFGADAWQAFWRVAVEGEIPADVAAALRMTLNAVYLAKGRVLRRLREEFADFLADHPPPAG